jgi:two-component system chemotaxis response regulator CheY
MTIDYSCMPKILIVDDAEFSRGRMTKVLGNAGYSVIEAGNGFEAVSRYCDEKPDVVLMDITMPEMDGISALREIRSVDPEARVVMLTRMGQETIVLEALEAGAKDYLVSPFEADRVLDALSKVLL